MGATEFAVGDIDYTAKKIVERGWYRTDAPIRTGWDYLNKQGTHSWGHYRLWVDNVYTGEVRARDDAAAINAFHNLYDLKYQTYEIEQVIVTTRTVEVSE